LIQNEIDHSDKDRTSEKQQTSWTGYFVH